MAVLRFNRFARARTMFNITALYFKVGDFVFLRNEQSKGSVMYGNNFIEVEGKLYYILNKMKKAVHFRSLGLLIERYLFSMCKEH